VTEVNRGPGTGLGTPALSLVTADQKTIVGDGSNTEPLTVPPGTVTVIVDGTSIGGTGTTAAPLHTIAEGTAVAVDNETIVGTGLASSPLAAVGGSSGAGNSDGVTLQGTGLLVNPFAIKAVQHNGTLTGAGTAGSPLATVAGATAVAVDGTTIGGDGVTGDALAVIPAGLAAKVAVAADGVTITGTGLTASPLMAQGGTISVAVDGTSIGGTGKTAAALHTIAGGTAVAVDGTTVTGSGLTGSPLVAHLTTTLGVNVENNGAALAGNPQATLNFLGLASLVGGIATIDLPIVNAANYPISGGDNTTQLQAAVNAAVASNRPLFIPQGSYVISSTIQVPVFNDLRVYSNGALITYNSDSFAAINFADNSSRLIVEGLRFQGANDDNFHTNQFYALVWLGNSSTSSTVDVTVRDCEFTQCGPIEFGSDGAAPGRFMFQNNRVINCPQSISTPYRSTIENNIFDATSQPGTRSHMIYIYGEAGGCVISGNVFRKSDQAAGIYAIQIRCTDAEYNQKQSFVISGNEFYQCWGCMWLGSDDEPIVENFNVTGNTFYNCTTGILMLGCRRSQVVGNTMLYDWQFTGPNTGVGIASTGSNLGGIAYSVADGVLIASNSIFNSQPYSGQLLVNSEPTAGDTITVGTSPTYTWVVGTPTAQYQIEINASLAECAANLAAVLMGTDAMSTPPNLVLRDLQDVIYGSETYEGSLTNLVVVASWATFAITVAGSGAVIPTAVVQNPGPGGAIQVETAQWPNIIGNTIKDMYNGLEIIGTLGANIAGNQFIGSACQRQHNLFTTFGPDNSFQYDPYYDQFEGRPWRFMPDSDGFSIDHLCPGIQVFQQFQDPGGLGKRGLVPVGNGQAILKLWYGQDLFNGNTPQSLGWNWANGESVEFSNGTTTHTFTFQRTAPGAGQFNTSVGLVALINATSDLTAAFVPYTNTGGDANPELMIVVTVVTPGVAGNSWFCQINTQLSATPGVRSTRMVGVVLVNRQGNPTPIAGLKCFFMGGAAAATETVVYTPLASQASQVTVTGYDSTSNELDPVVLWTNIVPGVGFTITHNAAVGTEQFFFSIN
jgi:hypothetical protein